MLISTNALSPNQVSSMLQSHGDRSAAIVFRKPNRGQENVIEHEVSCLKAAVSSIAKSSSVNSFSLHFPNYFVNGNDLDNSAFDQNSPELFNALGQEMVNLIKNGDLDNKEFHLILESNILDENHVNAVNKIVQAVGDSQIQSLHINNFGSNYLAAINDILVKSTNLIRFSLFPINVEMTQNDYDQLSNHINENRSLESVVISTNEYGSDMRSFNQSIESTLSLNSKRRELLKSFNSKTSNVFDSTKGRVLIDTLTSEFNPSDTEYGQSVADRFAASDAPSLVAEYLHSDDAYPIAQVSQKTFKVAKIPGEQVEEKAN